MSPDAHYLPHVVHDFNTYAAAVVCEADDRTKGKYYTFLDHLLVRSGSSGYLSSIALCEFGLGLPEEAFCHPQMAALWERCTDPVAIWSVCLRHLRSLGVSH